MSARYPQIFEPHLDSILAGETTEPAMLKEMLRKLLVTRRRYNDPYQAEGVELSTGMPHETSPNTYQGCLGGAPFSNYWSIDSQKARVEQGITFLQPIVGALVGNYPPITYGPGPNGGSVDSMGNFIPQGRP